jgi:hypothetical protein
LEFSAQQGEERNGLVADVDEHLVTRDCPPAPVRGNSRDLRTS